MLSHSQKIFFPLSHAHAQQYTKEETAALQILFVGHLLLLLLFPLLFWPKKKVGLPNRKDMTLSLSLFLSLSVQGYARISISDQEDQASFHEDFLIHDMIVN